MKAWYFFCVYAVTFSPLLVVASFFLKYFTTKPIWVKLVNTEIIHIGIKWFRIVRTEKQLVKEDICCNIILILSIASFAAEIANWLYVTTGRRGAVINNSYNLVQFILLSAFYHYLHEEGAAFRKRGIAVIGVVIVLGTALGNVFILGSFQPYLSTVWMLQCGIIVIYAIYTFLRMRGGPLVDDRQMSALGEGMYSTIVKIVSAPVWLNIALLLYFLVGLTISIISAYIEPQLLTNKALIETFYLLWIVHNTLCVAKNLLFCVGLYRAGKYGMARRLKLAPAKYTPLEAN